MAQITPLLGYPTDVSNKHAEVFLYTGPASYATGGDPIAASSLGWGGFDWLTPADTFDSTGTWYLRPIFTGSGAQTTVKIMFIVIATGVELAAAQNASTGTARMLAIGV